MKTEAAASYRCPYTHSALELIVDRATGDQVEAGALVNDAGHAYLIRDGVPDFRDPSRETMSDRERQQFEYYEATSGAYDGALEWLFATFSEDESAVRECLLERLALADARVVLEIGAGTCRDSIRIASRLPNGSRLFLQDFSPSILAAGRARMASAPPFACDVEYFIGGAGRLPFADDSTDAIYTFGAFNVFPDQRRCLAEMERVVRTGGRVVFGDESLAPWLRSSEYGAILVEANPLYADPVPIDVLPENARHVRLDWLLGNAFYVVSFEVCDRPLPLDLDLPIPGRRGGTLRSRRYGKLEGVSAEAKRLAEDEARRLGLSIHEWLDRTIRAAAKKSE